MTGNGLNGYRICGGTVVLLGVAALLDVAGIAPVPLDALSIVTIAVVGVMFIVEART